MLSITRQFRFDAAHKLERTELSDQENQLLYGKCSALHGHSYTLEVTVSGPVDESGMIINFTELKKLVTDLVITRYDHAYLNELEEYRNEVVTVENMALHIFRTLSKASEFNDLTLLRIRLYETADSWATVTA
ncbi:6-pyruvoyl trahydropterin synthase family protein [Desulforhopalus singaporensis]|uniref:6-carboxy-5,6,7,8-tetrahydropterin synthase n=1 Tax=Desulforhopalus singaporensis TaxID=91360 RepID=A0A1H0IZ83_9BACT|nr:6-carboxytetrahydropterin synthase [Desulforhopalus singaporensis]SDO36818.1 6-pyruvoyltetrahydropterin/6-carboxytetrahydropterin synthase [Desulforhopalus singaporensis]